MAELVGYHLFYRPMGLPYVYGNSLRRHLRRGDLIAALADDKSEIPMHPLGAWRQRVAANAARRWETHLSLTRQNAQQAMDVLSQIAGLDVHRPLKGVHPSLTYIFVSLQNKRQADEVLKRGAELGLGITRLFAHPLNRYPSLAPHLVRTSTPQAQALSDRTVTVTTSPYMQPNDSEAIADLFRSVMRGR